MRWRYFTCGNDNKSYYYDALDGAFIAHQFDDVLYFYNKREGNKFSKEFVPRTKIYDVTRKYRQSKYNPGFNNTIATVRLKSTGETIKYYLVSYKWNGPPVTEFLVPRHGNARKPSVSSFYRQDPCVQFKIDQMIDVGMSNDAIYSKLIHENPVTASETIRDPKVISNRRFEKQKESVRKEDKTEINSSESEAELIIRYLKENQFMKVANFTPNEYSTVNFSPRIINDIERFCLKMGGIFSVDTTFEVCEGLWLTDTSYPNLSLLKDDGTHPEFPGPSFWHFRKDRKAFRRFASELVVECPELLDLPRIGHDLDKAQMLGFKDIFRASASAWCTQHIKGRDSEQLRSLGVNQNDKSRILADIYGTQNDILLQNGLADSYDAEDFKTKLESLERIWERIAPGFHNWFLKNRTEIFTDCLTLEARRILGITDRFYSNVGWK